MIYFECIYALKQNVHPAVSDTVNINYSKVVVIVTYILYFLIEFFVVILVVLSVTER